jgi:hypothetical protein
LNKIDEARRRAIDPKPSKRSQETSKFSVCILSQSFLSNQTPNPLFFFFLKKKKLKKSRKKDKIRKV